MDNEFKYQQLGEDFDIKKQSLGEFEPDVATYEVTLGCGINTFECNPSGRWQDEVSFFGGLIFY